MFLEVIVVAEARADFEIGFGLAKRVNEESGANHDLKSRGMNLGEDFTVWGKVRSSAESRGRKFRRLSLSRGPFRGGDAETAWQVATLCQMNLSGEQPPTIMLVRDTDHEQERADGLIQAVAMLRERGLCILLALADPKREVWILHGFEPRNEREAILLKQQSGIIGFDPLIHSHRLTAKGNQGKRNAKLVLDALTEGDRDRETACWEKMELSELKKRGANTGLTSFLNQLEVWVRSSLAE
jgi:hypothetical protein